VYFSIELAEGPQDGQAVNLEIPRVTDWPPDVFIDKKVSRCVPGPLVGWQPERVAVVFWTYRRSDLTTPDGRRIYRWVRMSESTASPQCHDLP
jgi:hypothetical protein